MARFRLAAAYGQVKAEEIAEQIWRSAVPCRTMIRPSAASVSRACRMTPVPMPCRTLTSVIDGNSSPGTRIPDRMASVSVAVTCYQARRGSRGLIVSTGTLRCSMNGLPVQVRSPQRLSSAYSLSRMGPRTFRTFMGPGRA